MLALSIVALLGGVLAALAEPWAAPVAAAASVALVGLSLSRRRRPVSSGGAGPSADRALEAVDPRRDAAQPRALVAPLFEAVVLLDDDRRVISVNAAAEQLFGRPAAQIEGRRLIEVAWRSELEAVVRDADASAREVSLLDGRVVLAVAVRPPELNGLRLLALQDVTQLRRAERARAELVANFSHELRTPIAAARVLAETLESGVEEPERHQRYERQLVEQIDRLADMVDRLLRLARIETGAESFEFEPLRAQTLLETAARRIAPIAEARQAGVSVTPGDDTRVIGDAERLLEVLAILLDNALRFSPPRATVTVACAPLEGSVCFEVRDEGPGILPDERERVFERFYTGDRSRSPRTRREAGGTGLGLAIARHLVERHRGRIWVGEDGPGAVIRFTVPSAPETPSSE